jgi:hypothetical protein
MKKDLVKMISGNMYSIRTNGGTKSWKFNKLVDKCHCLMYESYELIEQVLMRKNKTELKEIYQMTNEYLETL